MRRGQDEDEGALTVTGRFQHPVPIPGNPSYGTWSLYRWEHQGVERHRTELTSDRAPWRDLFAALDEPGKMLPDGPVTPQDEADAIIACCWRFGSYAHVLTAGEIYPPFREDSSLSRIDDTEMKRINLEYSSGVSSWFDERQRERSRINRRARAALLHLAMPWRTERLAVEATDVDLLEARLRAILRAHPLPSEWPEQLTQRGEANHLVAWIYRNGPIEDIHAGRWSHGSEIPGFKRLYADDVRRVARFGSRRMAWYLAIRDRLDPSLRDLILRAKALGSASSWSEIAETSSVRFPGLAGTGPLEPRLRWLAARWPAAYGQIAV